MIALLAPLQSQADDLASHLDSTPARHVTLYGANGTGKSAILESAARSLGTRRPVISMRAGSDDLAATAAIDTMIAQLSDQGYRGRIRDSNQDPWTLRRERAATALQAASDDGLVIAVSDAHRLDALAERGGTPGRHAREVLTLVEQNRSRVLASRTLPRSTDREPQPIVSADLSGWLSNASLWPTLHVHAASLADLGPDWTQLPALSLRLLVALTAVGHRPATPPVDAAHAARLLAQVLGKQRRHRPRWAAWQLLAHVRSPWSLATVDVLLNALPITGDDELFAECLLHGDNQGLWHMHPIVRMTGLDSPVVGRPLAESLRESSGLAAIEHLRAEADRFRASGDETSAALVDAQLIDCVVLAGDTASLQGFEFPDPFDHVAGRYADADAAQLVYRRARGIDSHDATALRGIAGLARDTREDLDEAIALFKEAIRLEPGDLTTRAQLIKSLLAAGLPATAEGELAGALASFPGPDAADQFATRLLVPVAGHALHHGDLHLAALAARAASEMEPTAITARFARLANALIESVEYGEFVGPDRLGTAWWTQPQLLADRRAGLRRDRWLACRVDSSDGDGAVDIEYADVVREQGRPQDIAWLHLDRAELAAGCDDDLPDLLEGTILEIGLYGPAPAVEGDPEQTVVIRVIETSPFDLAELLSVDDGDEA